MSAHNLQRHRGVCGRVLALAVSVSLVAIVISPALAQENVNDYYTIENITTPQGLDPQVGGMDFFPDGRLVACFHRGEVYLYDPAKKVWQLFAEGLQEPLGIVAENDRTVVVMQRCELTRLVDEDGDGQADEYETVYDGFGMSGNYHEFSFGPARDKRGNYYVALNTASSGASIRPEIRGEFRHYRQTREQFDNEYDHRKAGRMYSAVPYRGWVLRISPDGEMTPVASGFRSPDGIGLDKRGRLWVTDNQGDWLGTSKLFHVRPGGFYGHPSSLVWTEGYDLGDPLSIPVSTLEEMRTRASVYFPHGSMANSPTQPLIDTTRGKFGPFAGQMLVGEMNQARLMRMMLEKVDDQWQGACVPLIDGGGLNGGVHRYAFDRDGALWVGQTRLQWAGGSGVQRIRWTGKTPFEVKKIRLTKKGFRLEFTGKLDKAVATDPATWSGERSFYRYHVAYGSPKFDKTPFTVKHVRVYKRGKGVEVVLDKVVPWRVYEFDLKKVRAADGSALLHPYLAYTLNRLVGGKTPPPDAATYAGK